MADSSFSDTTGPVKFKYLDHSDLYTYKVKEVKDDVEGADWVLNFTMKITGIVRREETDLEGGGYLALLHFANHGEFETYIPHASWRSVDLFQTAARKYSEGLPPLLCLFSQADLQRYTDSRMRAFYSEHPDGATPKKRVTLLGKQPDSNTFVFGPKLVFAEKDGRMKKIPIKETDYAWIPSLLPELAINESVDADPDRLFQEAAEAFPGDSVFAFALTLGAFYMGVHRDRVLSKFHRCPTVMCVGNTNCGKTYAASRCANFFASNAASTLEHKSLTPAAAREISSQRNMPTLLHDPTVASDLGNFIEEAYEGKPVTTTRGPSVPHASLIVTCNKDRLSQLREHMRVLSRCVLLSFLAEFRERRATALVKRSSRPTCSIDMVALLLQMTDDDLEEIAGFIDSVHDEVFANLEKYGMSESADRIAFNISMVFGFTVKALSLMDKSEFLGIDQLRDYVVHSQTKFAATWQSVSEAPTGLKRRYKEPPVPLSPAKKARAVADQSSIDKILNGVLDAVDIEEVKTMVTLTMHREDGQWNKYVALCEPRVSSALKSRQISVGFMGDCRKVVREISGSVPSIDVRFTKDVKARAMLIPATEVANSIVQRLAADQQEITAEGQKKGPAVSELDNQGASKAPSDDTESAIKHRFAEEELPDGSLQNEIQAGTSKATEERFPSPASTESDLEIRAGTAESQIIASEDDSVPGTSAAEKPAPGRFETGITTETASQEFSVKCEDCGKDILLRGQLMRCSKCKDAFHRNCQAVKTGTFINDNARKWQCKTCKAVTKSAKEASKSA